ncbi:MAG TPA: dephospho-CoA kinase [Clostridiaceae bacterium]|jgi:dephospho-CoA kinase|nr:dephospho-CoA kinase [Clostridiaceae bacterium]
MIVIGLTGGIASGKSSISNYIKTKDIVVIDADLIAREITEDQKILNKINKEFQDFDILSNCCKLDRKKLASIVFNDREKLNKLNSITHPEIKKRIKNLIDSYRKKGEKYCVVDAALLIEDNYMEMVDIIMLVYVNKEVQVQRLIKRDNLTTEEALNRINSQMPFEGKKNYADYIIDNSGSYEYTINQVNIVLNNIIHTGGRHEEKNF